MKIPKETKAKLRYQYLGVFCYKPKNQTRIYHLTSENVQGWQEGDELILKSPLSAILGKDLIETAKIHSYSITEEEVFENVRLTYFKTQLSEYAKWDYRIYQYLQSRGYDLPHYLLGGQTLQEVGLAIYE